jgi:hypothetical protein
MPEPDLGLGANRPEGVLHDRAHVDPLLQCRRWSQAKGSGARGCG